MPPLIEELERRHRQCFPKPVAHWRPDHPICYRYLRGLSADDAAAFIDNYAFAVSQIG